MELSKLVHILFFFFILSNSHKKFCDSAWFISKEITKFLGHMSPNTYNYSVQRSQLDFTFFDKCIRFFTWLSSLQYFHVISKDIVEKTHGTK